MPGIQIVVHTEPARIVGDDYYDIFQYNSGSAHGFALADVMGKGLPASILMSNLQASLRILGPEHEDHIDESTDDLLAGLRQAVVNFAGGFQDDMTMLIFKVL